MQQLDSNYSYVLTKLQDEEWNQILDDFDDASLFQTASFCTARQNSDKVEHLVVRRDNETVSAAQVRVIPIPFLGSSIAYIRWAPMCRRVRNEPDWDALQHALRILRLEYVDRRKSSLEITPYYKRDIEVELSPIFEEEKYFQLLNRKTERTIIINLEKPLEALRKGLDKKWRNCLNGAEKSNLQIRESSDSSLFDVFLPMYRQMLARKRLAEPGDIRRFMAMQEVLPARFKMRIVVAMDGGIPCAGAVCSSMGRRGIYLFGATSDAGMKNKASYLVQWRVIQWLKESGCTEYDLHGSNAQSNPGVYAFKMGLCGTNGKEVESAGYFDAYDGMRSGLSLRLAHLADYELKRLKTIYGKYRGFQG